MSILVVGSVAYDTVETPREKRERQLGGSASFFSIAMLGRGEVRCVGVVGDDFRQEDLDLLSARGADVSGIVRKAGKSFHWSGRYHDDMIEILPNPEHRGYYYVAHYRDLWNRLPRTVGTSSR